MAHVQMAHISLQFGDSTAQQAADLEKIFHRGKSRSWEWITGTEAGPGAGKQGELIKRYANKYGFKAYVPSTEKGPGGAADVWMAVRNSFILTDWRQHYIPVIKSGRESGSDRRYAPKGLAWVEYDSIYGHISVGAAHYLTGGREPGPASRHGKVNHWRENKKLAVVISEWAVEQGSGHDMVFYGGDQNMSDNKNSEPQGDTFFGGPLTSAWDELEKWEGTGHGNIDVIASYDRDRRVSAVRINALNDSEFKLNTDHFLVEAAYEIKPPKKRE